MGHELRTVANWMDRTLYGFRVPPVTPMLGPDPNRPRHKTSPNSRNRTPGGSVRRRSARMEESPGPGCATDSVPALGNKLAVREEEVGFAATVDGSKPGFLEASERRPRLGRRHSDVDADVADRNP